MADLATVPEDQPTPSTSGSGSGSGLPPAAKAASEQAVKAAIAETVPSASAGKEKEDGEIDESAAASSTTSPSKAKANGSGNGADSIQADGTGMRTVFSDPANFNVVHPLYSKWILWFDNASKQNKAKDWNEQLQEVMSFESVEEFWGLYNNIVPPSHIATNSNYYLFKSGIKPAWEDSANTNGGKWAVQLPRDKNRDTIDKYWLYTMLAAIGETFETPHGVEPSPDMPFTDEVTGVIVSSRKAFYRISIWTRSAESLAKVGDIGKHFKHGVLGVQGKINVSGGLTSEVEFQSHRDSQVRGKKPAFTA